MFRDFRDRGDLIITDNLCKILKLHNFNFIILLNFKIFKDTFCDKILLTIIYVLNFIIKFNNKIYRIKNINFHS